MLSLIVIVIKWAVKCVRHETEASLHNGLRTAHIPVLEAWDEVYVEIGFAIDHVYEFVSGSSDSFDAFGGQAFEDLIHELLILIVGSADNRADCPIVLVSISSEGSHVLRYWAHIREAVATSLLGCGFACLGIVVIDSEKAALLETDISAPDSWEIATVGIRLDEGFVNNSKEWTLV